MLPKTVTKSNTESSLFILSSQLCYYKGPAKFSQVARIAVEREIRSCYDHYGDYRKARGPVCKYSLEFIAMDKTYILLVSEKH